MEDRCVLCGEIVPEGTHVCFSCKASCNTVQKFEDPTLQIDRNKDGTYKLTINGTVIREKTTIKEASRLADIIFAWEEE